jgi:hypothetical protein
LLAASLLTYPLLLLLLPLLLQLLLKLLLALLPLLLPLLALLLMLPLLQRSNQHFCRNKNADASRLFYVCHFVR